MFTPYVPYPPNSGGRTRSFNLIKNLSKKHEITSYSYLREDHQAPDLSELKKYCSKIEIFRRKKSFASPIKILKTGFSLYPYLVNMYQDNFIKDAIAKELLSKKYDLIHVETYYIIPNLPFTNVPVLLAEQTIEYLVYQHYAETTSLFPFKPLLYIDAFKHKYWEKFYWQKAQKVVAMSDEDKQKMLSLVPDLRVDVVQNGVDMKFFNQRLSQKPRKFKRMLFVGNFNWLQNREASEVLVKHVWPLIAQKMPSARLWIVGREPTKEVRELAKYSGVTVSSDVEDIRTAYQGSDLLIAPIYGGGGTRYKILEAMASGLPVVSTEIGIEGLGARHDVHALIANDVRRLADYAVWVLKNKDKAKIMAKRARELVRNNFDWKPISINLEKIYEETARKS